MAGPRRAGAAATENPVVVGATDTAGNLERFESDVNNRALDGAYPSSAALSLSSSGFTVIVSGTALKTITVSHYWISFRLRSDLPA